MKNLFYVSFLGLSLFFYGAQTTLAIEDLSESTHDRPLFNYIADHPKEKEIKDLFYSFKSRIASDILETLKKLNLRGDIILPDDHSHIYKFFNVIKITPEEHLSSMLTELRHIMDIFESNTPEFLAGVTERILPFYTSHQSAIPTHFNVMALALKESIKQTDSFERAFSYLSGKTREQILGYHEIMETLFGRNPPNLVEAMDSFCALSENQAAGWALKLSKLFQNPSFGEEPRSTQLDIIRTLSRLAPTFRESIFSISRALTEGLQDNGRKFNAVLNRFSSREGESSKLECLEIVKPLMRSLGSVDELDLEVFEQIVDNVIAVSSFYPEQFKDVMLQLTVFNLYAKDLQVFLNSITQKGRKRISFQPLKDLDISYHFIQKLYQKEIGGGAVVLRRNSILKVFLQLSPDEKNVFATALNQASIQKNPELYFSIAEILCKTSSLSEEESIQSLKVQCTNSEKLNKTVKKLLKSIEKEGGTYTKLSGRSFTTESFI